MPDHYPAFHVRVELRARSTLLLILMHVAFRSSHTETIVVKRLPCNLLARDAFLRPCMLHPPQRRTSSPLRVPLPSVGCVRSSSLFELHVQLFHWIKVSGAVRVSARPPDLTACAET